MGMEGSQYMVIKQTPQGGVARQDPVGVIRGVKLSNGRGLEQSGIAEIAGHVEEGAGFLEGEQQHEPVRSNAPVDSPSQGKYTDDSQKDCVGDFLNTIFV